MKQLIGQWMGGLMGDASEDRMDRGDQDDSALVAGDNQSLVGGLSHFLAEILAKLETAYGGAPLDVEISYEGRVRDRKFWGDISRDAGIADVLKVLETSGVHFRIEGKKIVVTP